MGDDKLLNLVRAAEIAKCDPSTLRRAIDKGKLRAKKYGYNWMVRPADLQRWMESPHRQPSKNPHK
jgi:excisionase family DNA binding protein